MLQLICHLIGDFWLQSDWCAINKSKLGWEGFFACLVHVIIYTSCFLILTTSWKALLLIGISHFILDRFPIIVKRMIWWKNHFPNGQPPFEYCNTTGYYDDSPYNKRVPHTLHQKMWGKPRPFFITIWLYIISDNTLHLIFNYVALMLL